MFSKRHYEFLAMAIRKEPDVGLRIAMCLHLEEAFAKNSLAFSRITWRKACHVERQDLADYLEKELELE